MKLLTHTLFLISFLFVDMANAAVYKCKSETGKTTYQSRPCAKNDSESMVRISSIPASNNKSRSSIQFRNPIGSWVNKKNMNANITATGGFRMTDITGVAMSGKWQENNGSYSLKAKFHGTDIPVNMTYNSKTDILFLSKPGMLNTMIKYERRNRL